MYMRAGHVNSDVSMMNDQLYQIAMQNISSFNCGSSLVLLVTVLVDNVDIALAFCAREC